MAGIILAGGKSLRMGRDKALLLGGDKTLLEHTVGIVGTVASRVIIVAEVAHKYSVEGAECVVGDQYPGTGPLGGILTGLNQVESGYHVVVACDLPFLKPALLGLLLQLSEGHEACVPSIDSRLEPLCGVYHNSCIPTFHRVISQGEDLSIHMALKLLGLREVNEEELRSVDADLKSFTNINTLEDYGRANPSG